MKNQITRITFLSFFILLFSLFGCMPRKSATLKEPRTSTKATSTTETTSDASVVTILPCEPLDPANLPEYTCAGTRNAGPTLKNGHCSCKHPQYTTLSTDEGGRICFYKPLLESYVSGMLDFFRRRNVPPLSINIQTYYPSCTSESCALLVASCMLDEERYKYLLESVMHRDIVLLKVKIYTNDREEIERLFHDIRKNLQYAEMSIQTQKDCLLVEAE